jgi:hypothetical protein
VVFSTKNRWAWLATDWRQQLHAVNQECTRLLEEAGVEYDPRYLW